MFLLPSPFHGNGRSTRASPSTREVTRPSPGTWWKGMAKLDAINHGNQGWEENLARVANNIPGF